MSTATFIGHARCYGLSEALVEAEIRKLIEGGVDHFLCGGKGDFDGICAKIVHDLKAEYPNIVSELVLPYPGFQPFDPERYDCFLAPEGYETWNYKAVYEKRNRYMLEHSDVALCYVVHEWGGAAKTLRVAKRLGLPVIEMKA